jgi:hypothetical protein
LTDAQLEQVAGGRGQYPPGGYFEPHNSE